MIRAITDLIAELGRTCHNHGFQSKPIFAKTAHGSYLFDLQHVEWDEGMGAYVITMSTRDDWARLPERHVVTLPDDGTIFVEHSTDCRDERKELRTRCHFRELVQVAIDGGHLQPGIYYVWLEGQPPLLRWEDKL